MDFLGPLVADWQTFPSLAPDCVFCLVADCCLLTQTIWTGTIVHPLALEATYSVWPVSDDCECEVLSFASSLKNPHKLVGPKNRFIFMINERFPPFIN